MAGSDKMDENKVKFSLPLIQSRVGGRMTSMPAYIREKLKALESTHGVDIILAVESGSRAWGFESKDSDYDVRFLYKRELDSYLTLKDGRDTIQLMSDDKVLDFDGWDVKKALGLMYKSNPSLYEWLSSPTVYKETTDSLLIRDAAKLCYNPRAATYHYRGMANRNMAAYIRGRDKVRTKKYLYVIRPILACMYLEDYGTVVPMHFDVLMASVEQRVSQRIQAIITELIHRKRMGDELGMEPSIIALNGWLESQLVYFAKKVPEAPDKVDITVLDELFRDIIK